MTDRFVLWAVFAALLLVMLALDLGVFHRRAHTIRLREALVWSAVWILLSLLFNFGVYRHLGADSGLVFLTAYIVEKSLSVDNIFVFLLIFSYFTVPSKYQHRVLYWGILAAIILRGIFIGAGVALIQKFKWIVYIFGGFLIYTGIRVGLRPDEEVHPEKNPVLRLCRRFLAVTERYEGGHFFVHRNGRWLATPLFVVLLVVETSDVIFAVDSIPAVLAITTDPFIVFTSNILAILGLRALYFAVAGIMELFHYLHYGLCLILVFVGVKMILSRTVNVPTTLALSVIVVTIVACIAASLMWPRSAD